MIFMNCLSAMRRWIWSIADLVNRGQGLVSTWISTELGGSESGPLLMMLKRVIWALFTCIIAIGGAIVGIITGALKGQTTETGIFRGAAVGAVTGAITAVQLIELIINGEPFSKVALVCSLVNGKIFMEWVSPAVLKAYQWQISTVETNLMEISDIFDINATRGLSQDIINELPCEKFDPSPSLSHDIDCAICLQEFKHGEYMRKLPKCTHNFHIHCIDEWLIRHGTCPICRKDV